VAIVIRRSLGIAALACCCLLTTNIASAQQQRLIPRPLLSAVADEKTRQYQRLDTEKGPLCDSIANELGAYANLLSRSAELRAKTRGTSSELRQHLLDTNPPLVQSVPKLEDLQSENPDTRKAAEAELAKVAANTLDRLDLRLRDELLKLQQTASRKATERLGVACDYEECGRYVVRSCNPELIPQTSTRSVAGLGLTAGISWFNETFAPAAAQFLGERAESEAELWLATKFQNDLCTSRLRPWFEKTCQLSKALGGNGYQLPGTLFAAAIREDLEALPLVLVAEWLDLDRTAVAALFRAFRQSREGESPLGLLAALQVVTAPDCSAKPDAFACRLRWASQLIELTGDAAAATEAQLNGALDEWSAALVKAAAARCLAPDKTGCQVPTLEQSRTLLVAAYSLTRRLKDLSSSSRSEVSSVQRSVEIANLMVGTLNSAMDVYDWPNRDSGSCKKDNHNEWPCVRAATSIAARLMRGEYTEGARELVGSIVAYDQHLPKKLVPYVPLLVDLASAKDSSEAKTAFDAGAAPVGSWRIKRRQATVSVTGLVGTSLAYEQPTTHTDRYSGGLVGGLFGTLGIDVAIPIGSWTLGPYFSVLDVGQLFSAPIWPKEHSDNGVSGEPEAGGRFKSIQVFSPGGYFRAGVGNSPFTLGVGAALSPKLRRYEIYFNGERDGETQLTVVRVQGFVAIDVTILPF
jgi:hypothetical protein